MFLQDDGIKELSVVSRCHSPTEPYWLGLLFGYKIIIQAIGVFLAFKVRKVKIRGLNESREVSAILYITSVILAAMIVTSFVLGDYIDVDGFIFAVGLSTATTVVLIFTFASKVTLYLCTIDHITINMYYNSFRCGACTKILKGSMC